MAAGSDDAILDRLMLAFEGTRLPAAMARRLRDAPAAGVTLFRWSNVESPGQLRELTDAIHGAGRRSSGPPRLVAADQEGGQLVALGPGTTAFPGAMALGATGDPVLAERVALAIGRELLAMGITVAYAPVLDVATSPVNPAVGTRAFGDDPTAVAAMGAATIRGLHAVGVAATAKHFPGIGDMTVDSHLRLAAAAGDRARLDAVELAPFRAAIRAGVDLVMSGHIGIPAITGDPTLPATLSRRVMDGLLRRDLGFRGVSITDALDMRALAQGPDQAIDVIAAIVAGVDLLLSAPDPAARRRIEGTLVRAAARGLFPDAGLRASTRRVLDLRRRLGRTLAAPDRPDVAIVGGREHRALAREVAERSVTLVRDDAGLLPIRLARGARVVAVMPHPKDLTPADTSSEVAPGLASALRAAWPDATVEELTTAHPPTDEEIASVRIRATGADLVVIGTIDAARDRRQVAVVEALLAGDRPVVTVALRTPWDIEAYPGAATNLATYSILPESMAALAGILAGRLEPSGRLPVRVTRDARPRVGA